MLENLFGVSSGSEIAVKEMLLCMIMAFVVGVMISAVYALITEKQNRSNGLMLTLIILPAVMSVVIMLVGSNVARAFSVAGIFALVRFRSAQGESKDIVLLFFGVAGGLACGLGYVTFGLTVVLILCVLAVLSNMLIKRMSKTTYKQLRVIIPENMDYQGAFDDLFEEYAKTNELTRVKTTNMGTLYELTYEILFKEGADEKKFLDALRCRNGNLTVTLAKLLPKTEL